MSIFIFVWVPFFGRPYDVLSSVFCAFRYVVFLSFGFSPSGAVMVFVPRAFWCFLCVFFVSFGFPSLGVTVLFFPSVF